MAELSELRTAVNSFLTVWQGQEWQEILQDEVKRLDVPCNDDDFDGVCDGCPIQDGCELVYEITESLYRSRLKIVESAL